MKNPFSSLISLANQFNLRKLRKLYWYVFFHDFHALFEYLDHTDPFILLDVGAYKGEFTDLIAKRVNLQKAYLFEPNPTLFEELTHKYKGSNQLIPCKEVVSDREGTITFSIHNEATNSSILDSRPIEELAHVDQRIAQKVVLPSISLDAFVQREALPYVSLLKIDAQGAESLILSGGTQALQRTKAIWTEVSFKPLYEGSAVFHQIHEMLTEQGFVMVEIQRSFRATNREILQADALFINKQYIRNE